MAQFFQNLTLPKTGIEAIPVSCGVSAAHAGYVIVDHSQSRIDEVYFFRCELHEFDNLNPQKIGDAMRWADQMGDLLLAKGWTHSISGMNDTFEAGYLLMVDQHTLVRVQHNLTYGEVKDAEVYTDSFNKQSAVAEKEEYQIQYLDNPQTKGWYAVEVDQ